jgi:O-antigen/teichoic acid export membrane protein
LFASQFVASVYSSAGPIVIGQISSVREAGAYSAVERLVNAVGGASLLTHTAAYPRLAKDFRESRANYVVLVRNVLGLVLTICGVAAVVIWFGRGLLGRIVFGGMLEGRDALLAWSLAWLVVSGFGTVLTGYLTVSDRGREVMPLTLKVLGIAMVLGLPGSFLFGAEGWMASLVLSQLVVVYTVIRQWRHENGA